MEGDWLRQQLFYFLGGKQCPGRITGHIEQHLGRLIGKKMVSSLFHPALKGSDLNILEPWKHLVCPFKLNRIA